MPHDNSYKLLFSHPRMVHDLLVGFVREDWVADLDFDTLEQVSGSYVSDDLRDREDDIIWRIRWRGNHLYIYLLLEFQSTVDRYMAVRIMAYTALLYQDLIRNRQLTGGRLPPVLPIVLYNGERRWGAATNVAELVESMPGGLGRYRPSLRYLLLDEGAIIHSQQLDKGGSVNLAVTNLVAALFRLEYHRDEEDLIRVLGSLVEWLKDPAQTQLRRAFTVWIRRVLLPGRMPELNDIKELQELHEVHGMLEERVKSWHKRWEEQGIQRGMEKGIAKGIEQGIEQGARRTAINLVAATDLDDATIARVTGLKLSEIQQLRHDPGSEER